MKIWYQYPFVRLVVPLIAGIVTAISFNFPLPLFFLPVILLLLILYGLLVFEFSRKISYGWRWLNGFLVYLILFLSGYELTRIHTASLDPKNISHFSVQKSSLLVQVDEPVAERPKSYKIVARVLLFSDSLNWRQVSGKIMLYFEKDSAVRKLKYGDQMIIHTTLNEITPPMNPGEYNYKRYLSNRGIYHQGYVKAFSWEIVSRNKGNPVKALGIQLRQTMLEILMKQGIKGREYAVAAAILLGYDGFLEPEQVKEFSGSGAMHILCVSGLHVGIIYAILNFVLAFLNKKRNTRYLRVFLLLLLIWLYALMTGLSPSVMRASMMFSFVALGGMISRKTNIYNTLTASAFVLLIINPYFVMEVGFQLSYLAVFGIVWLYKPISVLFVSKNRLLRSVWQISVVSLAATLMTFPLSIFYFHQFPNLFLITNLIAIPASTLIIYNGILVLAFSFFPSLSLLFAKALTGIIWFLNFSVKMIEGQHFSVLRGIYINLFELILVFCLIVSFALLLLIRKKGYFYFSTGMAVLLLISISIRHLSNLKQQKIVVYHINKVTAIDFMDGKKGIFLADTAILRDDSKMGYHIQNSRIRSGQKMSDGLVPIDQSFRHDHLFKQGNFMQFYDITLLLIDKKFNYIPVQTKTKIDYLILSHDAALNINELSATFDFKLIIMDSSNSLWRTKQWIEECRQLKINFYSTRNGGAWVSQI